MNRSTIVFIVSMALLAAAVSVTALGAGSAQESASAADNQVTVDNFSFTPATLTVPSGAIVTWTNRDDVPHTIVHTDRKFKSKLLDTDESFSYTFTEPGTYVYFCSLHPRMTATIVVK